MATIAKENGTTFTPAPEGVHQAVCCDVIAAFGVTRKKPNGDEYKRDEVTIVWQLDKQNPDNGNKRFQVRRIFGLSLSQKSHLRPFLESWRGRKFTDLELKDGFDVDKLLGVNCNLQIIHDGDWANVQSVMPLGSGQPKIEVEGYVRKEAQAAPQTAAEAVAAAGIPSTIPGADDDIPF